MNETTEVTGCTIYTYTAQGKTTKPLMQIPLGPFITVLNITACVTCSGYEILQFSPLDLNSNNVKYICSCAILSLVFFYCDWLHV